MRVSRLYLPANYQPDTPLALSKEQAHYLLTVLRLKTGTELELFNGNGFTARGQLRVLGRKEAEIELNAITQQSTDSPIKTCLLQGISRGDRMDHSIQKSVELGVTAIQPLFTERCEVKLKGDKLEKRRQQWQAIAINACEQSGRTSVPDILPIQTLDEWFEHLTSPAYGLVLNPYAQQRLSTLPQPTQETLIHLLVGPEGGLSDKEVHLASQHGFNPIQLGPRILRTETAGPAVLAILQHQWGDL